MISRDWKLKIKRVDGQRVFYTIDGGREEQMGLSGFTTFFEPWSKR